MKKVILLVLVVMVASALLMAATPTKLIRLTIINKSGDDVYMRLTGSALTEAYYYLTVPSGDRDYPEIKIFTIMSDLYDRETWQCGGVKSTGNLIALSNTRLTFVPCGWVPLKALYRLWVFDADVADFSPFGPTYVCPYLDGVINFYGCRATNRGEPTMEKVAYWKYFSTASWRWYRDPSIYWFAKYGCYLLTYRVRTFKLPDGCAFRYQY